MFEIRIEDKNHELQNTDELQAEIIIGDFKERITLPTNYWSKHDYMTQWIDAVEYLLESKAVTKSALITEIYDADKSHFPAMIWPLYKTDDTVYVQNYYEKIELSPQKNLRNLYPLVHDREIPSREGEVQVSEWITTISDLSEWLEKLKDTQR